MTFGRPVFDAAERPSRSLRGAMIVLIGSLMFSATLLVALAPYFETTQAEANAERIAQVSAMQERIERMQAQVARLTQQIDGLQPSICRSLAESVSEQSLIAATSPPRRRETADPPAAWRTPKAR